MCKYINIYKYKTIWQQLQNSWLYTKVAVAVALLPANKSSCSAATLQTDSGSEYRRYFFKVVLTTLVPTSPQAIMNYKSLKQELKLHFLNVHAYNFYLFCALQCTIDRDFAVNL